MQGMSMNCTIQSYGLQRPHLVVSRISEYSLSCCWSEITDTTIMINVVQVYNGWTFWFLIKLKLGVACDGSKVNKPHAHVTAHTSWSDEIMAFVWGFPGCHHPTSGWVSRPDTWWRRIRWLMWQRCMSPLESERRRFGSPCCVDVPERMRAPWFPNVTRVDHLRWQILLCTPWSAYLVCVHKCNEYDFHLLCISFSAIRSEIRSVPYQNNSAHGKTSQGGEEQ